MAQSRRIAPYVPYSLPINTFSNHKDFLRKGPSKVVQIRLAETLEPYTFPSLPKHSYPTKLPSLLNRVKGSKRLSFNQYVLSNRRFSFSLTIAFIKKTRRIEKLTINDLWVPVFGPFKTQLNLWIKDLCHLQMMIFKLEGSMFLLAHKKSLSNALEAFIKSLRCQNEMKSLTIRLPGGVSWTTPILEISQISPETPVSFRRERA